MRHIWRSKLGKKKATGGKKGRNYLNTKPYQIFLIVIAVINLLFYCHDLWLYAYLSIPLVYELYQLVLAVPGFFSFIIPLILPVIGASWLSLRKNKKGFDKQDILVYGGTLLALLIIFESIGLLLIFNFPRGIEPNDYLFRLSEANSKRTKIPAFLLPIETWGINISDSQLNEKFEFGYVKENGRYRLKLQRVGNLGTAVDARQLTEDFLNANKEQFICLITKEQVDIELIDEYLRAGKTPAQYIPLKKREVDNNNLGKRFITTILLTNYIKTHWGVFKEWEKYTQTERYYRRLIRLVLQPSLNTGGGSGKQ